MVDSDLIFPKSIKIYNEENDYVIEKNSVYYSVSKSNHSVREQQMPNAPSSPYKCSYAIVDLIDGKHYSYLLSVSKATYIGEILKNKIFQIAEFEFISTMGDVVHQEDEKYIQMIRDFLARNNLFYSENFDLTTNLQTIYSNQTTNIPKNRRFNPNFCWNMNKDTMSNITHSANFDLFVRVINGYVGIKTVNCYNDEFVYAVISRKEKNRSGMRFLVRGADDNGNCSNFAESEEIIIHEEKSGLINLLSYLQIRGSMPLLWTQAPNLQLNPLIQPRDYNQSSNVFRKHMNYLTSNYGKVVLVNLIDKKKDQKNIGDCYQSLVKDFKENKSKNNILIILRYKF